MIKHFSTKFLKGFLALLPILLSIYILVWMFQLAESLAGTFLLIFLPDKAYIPGLGILVSVAVIYLAGTLIDKPGAKGIFKFIEGPFTIVPLVRTVYQAIKDFTAFLAPSKEKPKSRVVLVRLPNSEIDMVGLVTRESLLGMPAPMAVDEKVAVYLPMSYQFGGYTIFVPRSMVREISISTEEAMRSVLTAWVSGGLKNVPNDQSG